MAGVLCAGTAAASWASPDVTTARHATAAAARPVDAVSYADALVRAWGAGDEYRASHYASDGVLAALFGHARVGGKHWWRTGAEGAAGTVFVTYRNGSSSSTLTLGISDVGLGAGQGHDAYRVSFS